MRVLIVYESMFGNSRDIADAIAEGIGPYAHTDIVEVSHAPDEPGDDVDLLIVGGPTHAFGMSRPRTRADAATRVTTPVISAGVGLREWLDHLPRTRRRRSAASFDTRASIKVQGLTGSAARGAARLLRRRGYRMIRPPESFFVTDVTGPLVDGEVNRAGAWGREIGTGLEQREMRR